MDLIEKKQGLGNPFELVGEKKKEEVGDNKKRALE